MGFLTNVVQRGRQATRLDLVTAQVFTISLACNIQIHGISFITDLAQLFGPGNYLKLQPARLSRQCVKRFLKPIKRLNCLASSHL